MTGVPCAAGVILLVIVLASIAEAGQAAVPTGTPTSAQAPDLPVPVDGPPPPVPPAVISRDGSGRATIRAVRITTPVRIDGQLDEPIYTTTPSISDFIQVDPKEGALGTERTEVWLFFDGDHIYVSGLCWESQPDRLVANEMRRDTTLLFSGQDNFVFIFDTFHDRRNGVLFGVNPVGGRNDGQTNGQQYSGDWNPVWEFKVGRFEQGWTVEAAIPFKSLRYGPGGTQVWGFNVVRKNQWKNEVSFITRMPAARGHRGILEVSLAATVVGLEAPPGGKNLEIKPYVTFQLASDLTVVPRISNDVSGDVGVDVKYGLTQNLTADFTYNTDFAQVEADEQQVNLTRFSLFFPEKREFFLENQGTFAFGGAATSGAFAGTTDAPILFYSRRIGLEQGRAIPIEAGGRLTGRIGRFSLGVLNIHAGDEPAVGARDTNFSVLRIKRDVFRKSTIGLLYTKRSVAQSGLGTNEAYGVDASLGFFANLVVHTYWARTRTEGLSGEDTSYRAQLDYPGDRYGVQLERMVIGDNFNPEVGFVRRDDMERNFAQFRFSPRPRAIKAVRKFSWMGSLAYIENGTGRLETRDQAAEFAVELQNSDKLTLGYSDIYELLPRPFPIASGVILPVGGYDYGIARIGYNFGPHRTLAGNVLAEHGSFYNGHKTAITASQGRMTVMPQLSLEPIASVNWVDLVEGSFTTTLVGGRATYTPSPVMFVSALVQYNTSSHSISTNARLRWEYRPGSEVFVVYNEQRDTLAHRFADLANRALIFKINRLVRF